MSTSSPMDAASQLFMKRRRAFVACANCRKRKIKVSTALEPSALELTIKFSVPHCQMVTAGRVLGARQRD